MQNWAILPDNAFEDYREGQDSGGKVNQFAKNIEIKVSYDPAKYEGSEGDLQLFYFMRRLKDGGLY